MKFPFLSKLSRAVSFGAALLLATTEGVAQVGEWTLKMDFGGNEATSILKISKGEDGSLLGTLTSERGGGNVVGVRLARVGDEHLLGLQRL